VGYERLTNQDLENRIEQLHIVSGIEAMVVTAGRPWASCHGESRLPGTLYKV